MTERLFRLSVFAACFLAAFLSFDIQPMAGKTILPLIGGAPQGWLVTLAFFQTTLTAGYALVYFTRRLPARVAAGLVAVALGGAAWLFRPEVSFVPMDGGWSLFVFLWGWLGLPLVCLGTMAPLVQRLFFSAGSQNPYWLYALSNAGSLLGLLAYPFVIEPLSGLHDQASAWRWGILVLAGFALAAAGFARTQGTQDADTGPAPRLRQFATWMMFAMIPASLLSGSTLLISSDIGSFPLLWVIPLAIYLLTYIAAFRGAGISTHAGTMNVYLLVAAITLAAVMAGISLTRVLTGWGYALLILGLFSATALFCHARLYALRPEGGQLPLFYLALALGGAVGGAFNAFVAPLVFPLAYEFYYLLALALAVLSAPVVLTPSFRRMVWVGAGLVTLLLFARPFLPGGPVALLIAAVVMTGMMFTYLNPRVFALMAAACLSILLFSPFDASQEVRMRNFFGVLRVVDTPLTRVFIHGATLHGSQPHDPAWRGKPVAYYAAGSPVDDVLSAMPDGRIAVVGLGAGQIGCYGNARRPLDFYEIDPDVVTVARAQFHYLTDCPPASIVLGDARLTLAQATHKYRVFVLDAFSSDAIPAHLLTQEALAIYRNLLLPDGIILLHISNRFIDLTGPLAATARDAGLWSYQRFHHAPKDDPYSISSQWLVMGSDSRMPAILEAKGWTAPTPDAKGWSDDYAPLLRALRLF